MMFAHVSTLIDKDGKDHIIESSIMKVKKLREQNKEGTLPP